MRNIPQFNFPAFFEAAEILRKQGWEIISPAEIDNAEDKEAALKSPDGDLSKVEKTWGDFLSRDVKMLADDGIQAIVFLPNWHHSKGARLEAFVGLLCELKFFEYFKDGAQELPNEYVAGACAAQWMPGIVKKLAGVGPPLINYNGAA